MKLACPRCEARYALPDPPAGTPVRFACKRCGETIHVRADGTVAAPPPRAPAQTSAQPPAAGGWYVLVGREPTGPFDVAALGEKLTRRELDLSVFVWREDLPGWQRLGEVEALRRLVPVAPALVDPARPISLDEHVVAPAPASFDGLPASGSAQPAPPGEQTKVFLATAGLYARKRRQRLWAAGSIGAVLALAVLVILDVAGLLALPGMGVVYDATGLADPNVERAVARVESKLQGSDLSEEEREALRRKLLGLQSRREVAVGGERRRRPAPRPREAAAATPPAQRDLTEDVFADERKRDVGVTLGNASELQAQRLPSGLTPDALFQVIQGHSRSMTLCLEEALKKGERPAGKLEVELTIAPEGAVSEVQILSKQHRQGGFGACVVRRLQGWHFPPFEGDAVTVAFPYLLSTGS